MSRYEPGDRHHVELGSNLYNIQMRTETLLPNVDLKHGEVRRIGNHPVGGSPAFDIWEGEYLGREKVAIKVIRGVEVTPKVRERFLREVGIWRKIWEEDRGEYILPFYGACHDDGPYPYMVSPWMSNGDALSYVKKYPYVNRKIIVRPIVLMEYVHRHLPCCPRSGGSQRAFAFFTHRTLLSRTEISRLCAFYNPICALLANIFFCSKTSSSTTRATPC